MYQASQADSCALMMCASCLLGLNIPLPRAITNASIILTLHTILIARPVGARLREYIASRRFETHPASSGADAPIWASRAAPIPATNRHIVTMSSNASGTFHAPVTSRRTPKSKGPPAASR
jgi:hypothetical protein